MSDEHLPVATGQDDGDGPLSTLTPVSVVSGSEVDELVRSTRASIAMLSLQLRSAHAELDEAATAGPGTEEVRAAQELLRASLEAHVAARRDAHAAELEAAGEEAVRAIRRAQAEATAIVTAAHESSSALLASLAGDEDEPAPLLQVVPKQVGMSPPAQAVTGRDEPVGAAVGAGPGVERAADTPDPAAPEAGSDGAGRPAEDRASVPLDRAVAGDGYVGGLPTEDDDLWARLGMAESRHDEPWLHEPSGAVLAGVGGGALSAVATAPRRPAWARFLYADVVLPMVAVLIVFVVLLAWVG